jgi:hypothetical protein
MITATIAPDRFVELAAKLKAEAGLELVGDKGVLQKDGVTASYSYADGKLQIEVTDKPFLLPKSYCEGEIRAALVAHGVTCA